MWQHHRQLYIFVYSVAFLLITVSLRMGSLPLNDIVLVHSLSLQLHYSRGWATASFKSFLHPSQFRATTVQFLHPSFAVSSFTPSSQCNLGLPLGHFPPGSLRRTLLDKSSSSWRVTCPAHLSLLNLQNFTMSFSPHNVLVHRLKLLIHIFYASLYIYFYSKVSDFALIIGYLKKKGSYLFVAICIPFMLFRGLR